MNGGRTQINLTEPSLPTQTAKKIDDKQTGKVTGSHIVSRSSFSMEDRTAQFTNYLNFPNIRELRIPFETERQATIATKVLSPDPILKPQDFQVDYSSEKNVMLVQFRSIDDRVLRVGVSSIIDSIKTIVEAMDVLS